MLPLVTYGIDRRVDHAQAVEAVHAHRRRVDHRASSDAHPARARRVQRRLGVLRDPVEDLLVGRDVGPGRELAAVVRVERRLVQDAAGDADRLDPLLAVLLGREVVEAQRRMHARVGRA